MNKEQKHLAQYSAGLFDGDGSITTGVKKDDTWPDHGYNIQPECTITNRYVAGLFDAEGTVKPTVSQKDNSAINHHIEASSRITNSDDALIQRLGDYCESIGVDYHVYHNKPKTESRNPTFQFDVRGVENVKVFLQKLIPHLVAKREQAQIMVRDILPLLGSNEYTNRRGFLRAMYHIDRLNSMKGGKRGKYNLEYFEDLWGMEYDPSQYS